MIERRILLTVTLALLFLAAPLAAEAQTGKAYRVGVMFFNTRQVVIPFIEALEKGFRDRGYVAGRNFTIDYKFAEGQAERLPALAAELAHLNVDVFVVPFNTTAELVRQVAPKSPIVMTFSIDPVGTGLVNSLARPGGTITGLTVNAGPEITAKNMEILQETVPKGARLAVLFNAASQINVVSLQAVEKAAPKLGLKVIRVEIRSAKDFEQAFAVMKQENARGVLVLDEPLFFAHRQRVNDLALRNGLAVCWPNRPGVDAGGLVSYGANLPDLYRRAAIYVDKILKGARPGDLPIEQPTQFELVINMKTAKALGLTIPPSVRVRADHVIE